MFYGVFKIWVSLAPGGQGRWVGGGGGGVSRVISVNLDEFKNV